jgi:hypothetical protein
MEAAMNQETQPPPALEQMETAWEVQERPFTSPTPLIGPLLAWLRTAWNNISTKWYVRAVIQQQNEFNRLTVQQFHEVNHEVNRRFEAAGTRLTALDGRLTTFDGRLTAFDGRLVAQDHDQSDLVHDVGELTAHIVQLKRQLEVLEERFVALEREKETQVNSEELAPARPGGATQEVDLSKGIESGRDEQGE